MIHLIRESVAGILGRTGGDTLGGRLARGSAGTFGLTIFSKALSFLTGLLLARILGAEGYGAYSFAIAWVGLLSVFALMGFNRLLVREVAVYRTREAWSLLRGLIRRTEQIGFLNAVVLMLLTGGAGWLVTGSLDSALLQAMLIGLLILPIQSVTALRQSSMQGLEHIVRSQVPGRLVHPLLLALSLVGFYLLFGQALSANWALVLNAGAALFTLLLAGLLLRRVLPEQVREAEPAYRTASWTRSALPLLFVGSMLIINQRMDVLMVGMFLGEAATGIYNAAARWAESLIFIFQAVSVSLAPTIAGLHEKGDRARIQRVFTRSARVVFLLSLPVALVLVFGGYWLLLAFGPEFPAGLAALRILCISHLVSAFVGAAATLLIMTGFDREVGYTMAATGVLNIVLNLALIPRLGIEGAAIATTASIVVMDTAMAILIIRRLGIAPTILRVGTGRDTQ